MRDMTEERTWPPINAVKRGLKTGAVDGRWGERLRRDKPEEASPRVGTRQAKVPGSQRQANTGRNACATKTNTGRNACATMCLALVWLAPAWGQVAKPVASASPGAVMPVERPSVARQTISDLEKHFDSELSRVGGADPIDMLGLTRGLYLSDYGAVFTAEVSLIVTPSVSPFRPVMSDADKAKVHQRKLEHLPLLEKVMREMVLNTAMTFGTAGERVNVLNSGTEIVLAVRILYLPWENTVGLPGQIVMKADLKDALAGKIQTEIQ